MWRENLDFWGLATERGICRHVLANLIFLASGITEILLVWMKLTGGFLRRYSSFRRKMGLQPLGRRFPTSDMDEQSDRGSDSCIDIVVHHFVSFTTLKHLNETTATNKTPSPIQSLNDYQTRDRCRICSAMQCRHHGSGIGPAGRRG